MSTTPLRNSADMKQATGFKHSLGTCANTHMFA